MNTNVANRYEDEVITIEGPTFVRQRSGFSVEGIMASVRNIATLSEALRVLGAAVLLASMSVFLLQGWNDGNDISRYLLLLAQTGLLAAGGFAMSHGLKEAKGARIFFGLALVSIPANFTILGALLYSVFQWDGGLTTYPSFATWTIDSVANTGMTLAGAMVVLLPATLFCFAIMARHSAKALTLHFAVLNALLLLPIRSSMAAGAIALVGTMYALWIVSQLVKKDGALKTGEGKFALATLFIPSSIILFRSMYFYQVDSLMVAMLSMALFLAARQASVFPDRSKRLALFLDVLSLPLALAIAVSLTDAFHGAIASALQAPLFAAVYSGLALDIIHRTGSRRLATIIGVSISLFVSLSFVFSVATAPGALTAILCMAAGVLLVLAGTTLKNPPAAVAGFVTILAGVVFGFDPIVAYVVTSSWVDLAIFGFCAITLGSLLDRYGVALKLHLGKWADGLRERREEIALDD